MTDPSCHHPYFHLTSFRWGQVHIFDCDAIQLVNDDCFHATSQRWSFQAFSAWLKNRTAGSPPFVYFETMLHWDTAHTVPNQAQVMRDFARQYGKRPNTAALVRRGSSGQC